MLKKCCHVDLEPDCRFFPIDFKCLILGQNLSFFTGIFFLTAFIKILTTLSILRIGLSLSGFNFGIIVFALAFVLSALVMNSYWGSRGLSTSPLGFAEYKSKEQIEYFHRPFMERHVDPAVLDRFWSMSTRIGDNKIGPNESSLALRKPVAFPVLASAFLVSELKEAFQVGFLILVPFLIIDILVVNILMLLNIDQIKAVSVSLPFKLLLFVSVDGWTLLSERLLSGYIT